MASFVKKSTGWQYRVSYKDGDKYRTRSLGGFATKKEAQMAAAELERKVAVGLDFKAGDRLFTEYYEDWVNTFKLGKFSLATDSLYRTALNIVQLNFQGYKLKQVTKTVYQKFLNEYAVGRSYRSVKKVHHEIGACLKEAFRNGDIPSDVTYKILITGSAPKPEEEKYLNENEAMRLMQAMLDDIKLRYTSRYMCILQLATGARIGEIMAVTFDSLDFENNTLEISKSWDYKYTLGFNPTKNKKVRKISVDPQTMAIIKPFYDDVRKRSLTGPIKNPNNLVFVDRHMEPISVVAVSHMLQKACSRAGVRRITSHALRHTHASIMLQHGLDVQYVADRLGDTVMVLSQTYAHLLKEMKEKGDSQAIEIAGGLYGVV